MISGNSAEVGKKKARGDGIKIRLEKDISEGEEMGRKRKMSSA